MKKRILAIILALLLAASLLPMGALADGDIYVSVGGKAFTEFGQTIRIGGGEAQLTSKDGKTYLTLSCVNLTSFDNLGSDDGMTYYAGIVYSGDNRFIIRSVNSSITAPQHGDNALYEGIYATESTFQVAVEGDLTIKNTDYGIDAPAVSLGTSSLNISTVGGDAIYTKELYVLSDGALNLSSVGYSTVTADLISFEKADAPAANIRLTADMRYGYGDVIALCGRSIGTMRPLNVSVTADFSGYTGDDVLLCAGVLTDNLQFSGYYGDVTTRVSSSIDVKGSDNVAITGIYTSRLGNEYGSNSLSSMLNISGKHAGAIGIEFDEFDSVSDITIESRIKGAVETDVPLVVLTEEGKNFTAGEIYAATDCKEGVAMICPPETGFVDASGKALTVYTPKNGSLKTFAMEELPVIGTDVPESINTVVDEGGAPASTVIMNNRDSAFRDIDIPSQKNFKTAILWAVDNGVTAGITPVEFRPTDPCTRGQVVTFLWRAAGKPTPETTDNPFVDVKESSAFYKAILWAYENGIVAGLDSTHFGPSNPCTRAQVVTFLWRYAGKPASETTDNPFTDVKSGAFYNAILWGSENKIVSGYSDNTFRPQNTCTRAQIVTFLYRYLG